MAHARWLGLQGPRRDRPPLSVTRPAQMGVSLGPLCTGMGEQCFQWECPAFFPLGDRHLLIVSPLYRDLPGLRGTVEDVGVVLEQSI